MTKSFNTIIFILSILTILSCQNAKNERPEIDNRQSQIKTVEHKSTQFSQTENKEDEAIQITKKDSLDIIFIGKTTKELNKYNFYSCFGEMIENESVNEKYAISEYSLNIDNCRNGKSKIFLEKFKNYYDQGKANFEIKDELIVQSSCPKRCYSKIVQRFGDSKFEKNYLIEYEDNSKEIITKIYNLWEIDLSKEKFIQIAIPKKIKFNNPNYADGI